MKTQNPFTGRSSGSLANVTASTYLGQNILKSKPLEVRNPQSPKQLNVRKLLSMAAKLSKALQASTAIAKRSARTGRVTNKTARTALMSAIMATKHGETPFANLSTDGIVLQGSGIAQVQGAALDENTGPLDLTASWNPAVPTGGSASDILTVVLFDMLNGKAAQVTTSVARSAGTASITVPANVFSGTPQLAGFLCFESTDGTAFDSIIST